MTSEPRIIKYESDKFIKKGDYYGAVRESLKESGVLFNKRSKIKKTNFEKIKAMSIDELVNLILMPLCKTCVYIDKCPMSEDFDCKNGVKQWLEGEEE